MEYIEEIARRHIIPQVIPNYLGIEKSVKSLPYWEACRSCKGICCTNATGATRRNADGLINEFERMVIEITFPEYQSHVNDGEETRYYNAAEKIPAFKYCDFNSDTGCVIPEGRPSICISYLCDERREMVEQNVSSKAREVMGGHYKISRALSGLLPTNSRRSKDDIWAEKQHMRDHYNVENPQIEDRIIFINSAFEKSEEIINSNKDFKVKFDFKPIKIPSVYYSHNY